MEGLHWLGRSGVKHEIDAFLVTRIGKVGLIECTRSPINLMEVMKLDAKIRDLQADFGLVLSLSRVEKDASKYGKSCYIHSFGDILEDVKNTEEDITNTLKVIG